MNTQKIAQPIRFLVTFNLILFLISPPVSLASARLADTGPTSGLNAPAAGAEAQITVRDADLATPATVSGVAVQGLAPSVPGLAITATLTYTLTDLGVGFIPTAINDLGQTVGYIDELKPSHAFLWLPAEAYNLPAGLNDLGTLGGVAARATAINNLGQVAGYYSDGSTLHPFVWQNGITTTLEGAAVSVNAINEAGQVAGAAVFPVGGSEERHAALWAGGGLTDLGTLGGSMSHASAIDANGNVAGGADAPDGYSHPFLYRNSLQDLGTLGGLNGGARGMNDVGEVVGDAEVASGRMHAFLWTEAGGMIDLGTLGGSTSHAEDINNRGQVVGSSSTDGAFTYSAFLWQDGNGNGQSDAGEMRDLNDLIPPDSGWQLTRATAINAGGQIVGAGTFEGAQHGFLLTPGEPAWTLMFYLDGDNNLSHTYPPIFNQLELAANNPAVQVVALWDGPAAGDSNYYLVQHDTDLGKLASYTDGVNRWPQGELDMSFPTALSDYVIWAMTNFPAQHYALILDNHGSGLGGGLCDGTCSNLMNLPEIKLALATAFEGTGTKIDVLYMAMCLMGMIEDSYQFKDYADYYVASENLQWAFTTPYRDYVSGISAASTPDQVARLFADAYADDSQAAGKAYTISVVDMAQLDGLVTATNQLAAALASRMDVISGTLTTVASQVQRYDNRGSDRLINSTDTYVDLYHFADLVSVNLLDYTDILAPALNVMAGVENYVIHERHLSDKTYNLDNSHGVSIFFPATASSFYDPANYDFAVGANWGGAAAAQGVEAQAATTWGGMLVRYFQVTQPGGPDDATPPEPVAKLNPLTNVYLPLILRSSP